MLRKKIDKKILRNHLQSQLRTLTHKPSDSPELDNAAIHELKMAIAAINIKIEELENKIESVTKDLNNSQQQNESSFQLR